MNISTWISAFRLRTLPLALSSIAMGGFLALEAGAFSYGIFLLSVLTTILLQILSNLANDYGDSIHGADHSERKGPARAVQSGAITKPAMRKALIVFVVLCLLSGVTLLIVAFGNEWRGILAFLVLGLLSIAAAMAYTVGRKPYGYLGLGDVSVLIFFGIVGVMGSYYLYTKTISWLEVLPALSCGLFAVGVLNINNIRDIESDRKAGKFSVPVRIGRNKAIVYHWCLLAGGLTCGLVYAVFTFNSGWQFLFLLSVPFFIVNGLAVMRKPPHTLDPFLRQMAMSTLAFVLLFGLGIFLSSL